MLVGGVELQVHGLEQIALVCTSDATEQNTTANGRVFQVRSIGIISGVFALLYLLRMWQPRGEEHGFFGAIARPLPDAKTLDQIAYKTAVVTLPLFGIGIVFGAIWAEVAWGRFWGWDAKETVSMITWILYAAYLHARATAGWKSTAAAWINVFALCMTIFNMTYVNTVIAGLHSYAGLN